MRLLLNAHFDPEVARALREAGYDVVALLELGPDLYQAGDLDVLHYAASQRRAVVSRNVRDFVLLHRLWSGEERTHWGIILVHPRTIPEGDRSGEIRALEALLESHPAEDGLKDGLVWLKRSA